MTHFDTHISTCPKCRYKRGQLCPVGRKLLLAAAVPTIEHDVPKQTEQKEQPCKTQLT